MKDRNRPMSSIVKPLLGILGGMGPLATAHFMTELAMLAGARRDQDHCRTVVYSDPGVPDRSDALISGGCSPLPAMLAGIAFLEDCRADAIAIPCNTAHFWLGPLSHATRVPIIGIVGAVIAELQRCGIGSGPVGLLGTPGMMRARVYHASLVEGGYRAITPDATDVVACVEPAIRAVKAGDILQAQARLRPVLDALEARGVRAIILGCTELPLAAQGYRPPSGLAVVDSTRSLARACLSWVENASVEPACRPAVCP